MSIQDLEQIVSVKLKNAILQSSTFKVTPEYTDDILILGKKTNYKRRNGIGFSFYENKVNMSDVEHKIDKIISLIDLALKKEQLAYDTFVFTVTTKMINSNLVFSVPFAPINYAKI